MRVVLYDGRVRSPTHERPVQFHFSDRSPGLLRIPPGVWHADQNTGDEVVRFVNFATRAFDPAHPDSTAWTHTRTPSRLTGRCATGSDHARAGLVPPGEPGPPTSPMRSAGCWSPFAAVHGRRRVRHARHEPERRRLRRSRSRVASRPRRLAATGGASARI